jgi:hypothetical protein
MQSHSRCESLFPTGNDSCMLLVTIGMGMLIPSCNVLYLLQRSHDYVGLPSQTIDSPPRSDVAFATPCDTAFRHRRLGHLNMHNLEAQHSHGVPSVPVMPSVVATTSCDSCLLSNVIAARCKSHGISQTRVSLATIIVRQLGSYESPLSLWHVVLSQCH